MPDLACDLPVGNLSDQFFLKMNARNVLYGLSVLGPRNAETALYCIAGMKIVNHPLVTGQLDAVAVEIGLHQPFDSALSVSQRPRMIF